MSYDNRDSIDFAKTDIPKLFRSIFIPTLFGMLFNVAFILTDGVFVGHGVGPAGLACINLVAPIMMIMTGLGMMFGMGCSVVAAIHLSQDNLKAARINVTQAFITSGVMSVLVGLLLYLFSDGVLRLLGVPDELMDMAKEYYIWFIPTCLFLMFQLVGEFVIRLDGSPKFAMFANIIPAVVNIVLDYTFIIPCNMDLKGAALATDIGTGIGALMAFYYMFFRVDKLHFYRLKHTWTSLRLTCRNVVYMIRLGLSALVGELAVAVMMLVGNIVFGKYLGEDGIAAYSVICYLFPVVYMVYSAVSTSAQPIISFNYGAGETARVRYTFRHSVVVSLAFGMVVTLVFCLFAPTIISVFLQSDAGAFPLAVKGLPLYALGFIFEAYNISAIGYYQSTEQAFFSTSLMLLRGIVLLVPAFILLPLWLGTAGLWLAVPLTELLTAVIAAIRIRK